MCPEIVRYSRRIVVRFSSLPLSVDICIPNGHRRDCEDVQKPPTSGVVKARTSRAAEFEHNGMTPSTVVRLLSVSAGPLLHSSRLASRAIFSRHQTHPVLRITASLSAPTMMTSPLELTLKCCPARHQNRSDEREGLVK
jgi:hypothetical protein